MNILDYCIATGEKQGNSKHFKNLLAIHSNKLKLESELRLAKNMLNEKEKELIKRGLRLQKMSSDINLLKTKENALNERINTLEEENKHLKESIELNFDNFKAPKKT